MKRNVISVSLLVTTRQAVARMVKNRIGLLPGVMNAACRSAWSDYGIY